MFFVILDVRVSHNIYTIDYIISLHCINYIFIVVCMYYSVSKLRDKCCDGTRYGCTFICQCIGDYATKGIYIHYSITEYTSLLHTNIYLI